VIDRLKQFFNEHAVKKQTKIDFEVISESIGDVQKTKCIKITNESKKSENEIIAELAFEIGFVQYQDQDESSCESITLHFDLKRGTALQMYNYIEKMRYSLARIRAN